MIADRNWVLRNKTQWACGECAGKAKDGPFLAAIGVYEGNTYTCPKCDRQFVVREVK